jgi:ATP-dependent Clp protease ATP-binding subunit ClpC
MRSEVVDTGHLLLATLMVEDCEAARILNRVGVTLDGASAVIFGAMPVGEGTEWWGVAPMNPIARRAENAAFSIARELGHSQCGTVHLLFAIAAESEGTAAWALRQLGVSSEELAATLKAALEAY